MALWFAQALLADGWAHNVRITLHDGMLASVSPETPAQPGDERHAIGLPALGNVHSHAFQRAMAGLAEMPGPGGDDFWSWRELMYRFALRMSPDQLCAVAAMAYAEMLESGFAHVGEFHYLHHDPDGRPYADPAEMSLRIAEAATQTGIGLTLLPVLYMASGFGGAPPRAEQRRFISSLDGYAALHQRLRSALDPLGITVGTAPHSLRAVTNEGLAAATALAGHAPIHIHIAEQTGEVEDCLRHSGQRPVERLLDTAPVGHRWCLVHATHLTPAERVGIAQSGAVVGLCPLTEANLGDGIFPGREFLTDGGRFGIGSDSNVLIDAGHELMLLEYSQRLATRSRNVISGAQGQSTGRALFEAALAGGNQALGIRTTGVRAGAPANLISLNADHPALAARSGDALLDSWIFGGGKPLIDRVWSKGQCVVADGEHRARAAIVARYREVLAALLG